MMHTDLAVTFLHMAVLQCVRMKNAETLRGDYVMQSGCRQFDVCHLASHLAGTGSHLL
jgi:hypothetical protein